MKLKKTFPHLSTFTTSALVCSVVVFMSACNNTKADAAAVAKEINAQAMCSLDGMSLADYPGPKAQINYAGDAEATFFCDTVEFFNTVLTPEQVRKVDSMYVQDMGKANWEAPREHWIDPKQGFYVVGSKRPGSMGPTIASFAQEADAQKHITQWGGKLFRFNEIKKDMVDLSGGALHDERM